jgi:hypothetical protein
VLHLLTASAAVYALAGTPWSPAGCGNAARTSAYGIAVKVDDFPTAVAILHALVDVLHDSDQPERVAETLLELANSHWVCR